MGVHAKMTAIADAIREKTGNTEALTLDGMAAGVGEVYAAGEKSAYDAFWGTYTDEGTRDQYSFAFAGYCWTEDILKTNPYTIKPGGAVGMFQYTEMKDLRFMSIDTSGVYNLRSAFANASKLRAIFNLDCSNLIVTLNDTFSGSTVLEDVTFTEGSIKQNITIKDSPVLRKDSIISLINGLASSASGKIAIVNLTAVNNAFESSEGAADGSTSQEWADLIATKANWTISMI